MSYRLTEAGAALEPALRELAEWAKAHLPEASAFPETSLERPAGVHG